ncbi:MAG: hypothetical protein LBD52_02420, partial [Prevotellaceae bacterium]|nr:hypothetical protein [Prevotellaceae bacterium]
IAPISAVNLYFRSNGQRYKKSQSIQNKSIGILFLFAECPFFNMEKTGKFRCWHLYYKSNEKGKQIPGASL